MNDSSVNLSLPPIPFDVQQFAAANDISTYLNSVIDMAQQAFPSCAVTVSLGQDAENELHQYIALDVEVGDLRAEDLLAGQRAWSQGIRRVCPSRHAVYFVLGWG